MRTVPRRSSLALLLAVAAAVAAPAVASADEGQIIVKYASGADAQDRADAREDAGVVRDQALPVPSTELVTPDAGTSVGQAVADLERSPDVAFAEPDQPRRAFDVYPDEARVDANGVGLNDVPFSRLWALHNTGQSIFGRTGFAGADIGAPAAWGVTTGSSTVKVAVVDSGVDPTHPDLFANLVSGYDYAYNDSDPTDYDGHGTHVAGIIAARGNNSIGVTGVTWQTSLMPVQALDATGEGTTSDIVSAYTYAAAHGARIVNASFGGSSFSQAEYNAIKAAPNVLFVAAAGNDGVNDDTTPSYPCAYNLANILCVAATDNTDRLASFSNVGRTSVDIAAPGVNIYSTYKCDGYAWMSGTSMAAPEVSGAAALVLAQFPTLTATQLRSKLLATTDPLPPADAAKIAGGRLDVAKAVGATVTPPPGQTTNAGDGGATGTSTVFAAPRVNEPAPPTPACPPAPVRAGNGTPDTTPPVVPVTPTPVTPSTPSTPVPVVSAPDTAGPAGDRTAPTVSAALSGRGALRLLLAGRLGVSTTASERAALRVELRVDNRTAKKLHLTKGASTVTIATGSASLAQAGRTSVKVRVSAQAKRALAKLRSIKVSVRATATDAAGNGRTRSRTATITR